MIRSLRSVKASQWLMALMLAAAPLSLFGCGDDDPPPAGGSGGGHVKVFVTTAAFDGNFPGLAGADAACTNAATTAGLPGTWTAWLSDNTTSAIDRIFDGGTSYRLVNGTVVADDLADLVNGTLDSPIQVDETGSTLAGSFEVWTSTDADGTNPGVGTCLNWSTNDNAERAQIGLADATSASWTDVGGGNPCDVFNRLYCFADATSK